RCIAGRGAAPPRGHGGGSEAGGGESGVKRLGRLYAALATGCGYSYRTIDGMTLAEAGEIFDYWAENPPPHLLLQAIARMLGWAATRCTTALRPSRRAPAAAGSAPQDDVTFWMASQESVILRGREAAVSKDAGSRSSRMGSELLTVLSNSTWAA